MPDEQYYNWEEALRRKAAEHDEPFELAHWKQMERMLNGKSARRPLIFWLLLLPDVGTVLLMGLLFFTVNTRQYADDDSQTQIGVSQISDVKNASPDKKDNPLKNSSAEDVALHQADNKPERSAQSISNFTDARKTNPAQEKSLYSKQNMRGTSFSTVSQISRRESIKQRKPGNEEKVLAGKKFEDDNSAHTSQSLSLKQNEQNSALLSNEAVNASVKAHQDLQAKKENLSVNDDAGNTIQSIVKDVAVLKNTSADSTVGLGDVQEKSAQKIDGAANRKWSLTAIIGAEFTFAKGGELQRPGLQFGLLVGRAITPRITVQTGAMLTSKLYTAGPYAYKANPATYWGQVKINEAYADCNVLEIPLRFTYAKGKSKWYYTIGAHAAIMQKEVYRLYYTNANGESRIGYPQYASNSVAPLAFASVSAGRRFAVSKRMSLLLEPQIKLPLQGVGEGDIKLWSAGLQVGLQLK